MTQNSSNTVPSSEYSEGQVPKVDLSVDQVVKVMNRISFLADVLTNDVIVDKCKCHSTAYSGPVTCKSKCRHLARRSIQHAALSRKYLQEFLEHATEYQASRNKYTLDIFRLFDKDGLEDLAEFVNSPTVEDLQEVEEVYYQSGLLDKDISSPEVQRHLTELQSDLSEVVRQVEYTWSDDDIAIIPPDLEDEFPLAIMMIDSQDENPISFFHSINGHLELKTWSYHFDMSISLQPSSYNEYLDAMAMTMPHLRRDILDYILYCTKENDWIEQISLRDLIIEARKHFVLYYANHITARMRMGFDDRIEPQNGIFNTIMHVWKNAPWREEARYFPGVANRVWNNSLRNYAQLREDELKNPEGLHQLSGFFENLMLFYQEYRRCQTRTDFVLCYYKYLKMQFHISFANEAVTWICAIVSELTEEPEPDVQSGVCFADIVEAYKGVTQSAIFEKMSKLAMLVGSLAMYWLAGESLTMKAFTDIAKQVYSGLKATDLFGQILETIQCIYARCIPFIKGDAPFSTIWQGLGDGRALDLEIITFIGHANKYIEGTAEAQSPAPEALLVKSICLLDKLTALLKAATKDIDRVPLKRSILQIESLRNAINNKHNNSGVRSKPFTISLFGTTGVGKTCLSFEIAVMLQRALGVDAGTQFIYRKDESDQYDSSLNNLHNTFILDDLGNTTPDKAKTISTEPIIAYANNCPKFAVMADLASKGVVAIKPKVLIITTNIKTLHARVFSIAPDAVLRRVENHITVRVKKEYADINGQLREDVDPMTENYDCWLFDVERFSPNSTHPKAVRGFEPQPDEKGDDMLGVSFETLCRYLVRHSKKFHQRQSAYVEHTKVAHLQEYCECGMRKSVCTQCVPPTLSPLVQNGLFAEINKTFTCAMGVREVLLYPVGRGMIADLIKAKIVDAIILTVISLCTGKFVPWHIILSMWAACLMLFTMFSIYRISTYRVVMKYDGVCVKLAKAYANHALGRHAGLIAGFVMMAGAYTAYTKLQGTIDVQGSVPSRPKVAFEVGKLPPTWSKEILAPMPSNPFTTTTTGDQLAEMLQRKMCSLRVYSHTTQEYAATFPICTNFWIVPWHLIIKDYDMVKIVNADDEAINGSVSLFRAGSYKRIANTDCALLYVPGKGDQLNLIKYFPRKDMFKTSRPECKELPCKLVLYEQKPIEKEGRKVLSAEADICGVRTTNSSIAPKNIDIPYWGGQYQSPVATFTGMCGCPIVTDHSAPYIMGVHSAGVTGTHAANFCTIMQEDVLECIRSMTSEQTPMMQGSQSGPMLLGGEDMPFKHELPKNNHFKFIEKAEVDILGCHAGRKRRYTSMVQPTDFSDDIAEAFGVDRKHGKPALINHWYPARLWVESCANSKPVHMEYLTLAYQNYAERVFNFLKEEHKSEICVLEDIVNTSGLDGWRGLQKMNYNASAGIPYGKPKRNYVQESSDFFDGISVPYELTDDMKRDVEELEDIYKQGLRGYAPHRANRKDEAIKLNKAKVRIFSGTNMPYLFLMRKYFLTISVFMQKHPEIFESAVGVNPYSSEWTRLHKYITQFGERRTVAGDYEKYDQFVHSMMTYAGFKLLIRIAEFAGFDEEDILIMRGLATDTCNPVYELDGLWIKVGGSSPSGHALTVVINGIVNSLYARVAYYKQLARLENAGHDILDFNNNVAFMSYGDDNVMTVHERASFFNHCTYQQALKEYGLNYTMADKLAESVPYIQFSEATFLKRSWVWSEEYGRYLAPLEKDSIFKMLHTFGVSKVAPRKQQLADILRSANQEFFMHGDDVFVEAREKLMDVAEKYDLAHFLPGSQLPTLPEMKEWYEAA